jgi:hypothetical protein
MLVKDLRQMAALMAHDPRYSEVTKEDWILYMASAALDARNSGWYLHAEDSESLEISSAWEYTVPSGFARIHGLYVEDTHNGVSVYDVHPIDRVNYEIRLNGGVPVIVFNSAHDLTPGRHIKVVGQVRPTIYVDENETIDRGMESYIRERTLYFVFRFMGAGGSELARWRQQMSTQAWQSSEVFLQKHPQEFRQAPDSIVVPGRG